MASVHHYYVVDDDGVETGPYDTFGEADRVARHEQAQVKEIEYEFADSSIVVDYRKGA